MTDVGLQDEPEIVQDVFPAIPGIPPAVLRKALGFTGSQSIDDLLLNRELG